MTADEIARLLDQLGQKLTPGAERAFALAVQYQITNAVVGIVFAVILLVGGGIPAFMIGRRAIAEDSEGWGITALIFGALYACAALLALLLIGVNVVTLLNPEYSALRDILGRLPR